MTKTIDAPSGEVVWRAAPGRAKGLSFVLSDENVGDDGLVIRSGGWDLGRFERNPIALFSHDSRFPIGVWENVRTEGSRLVADLLLAKRGTSQRIDELISLVEQGIVRGVSVGFRILDRDGAIVTRSKLLEASLVSVPALETALAMARSLKISDDTIRLAFGEHAAKGQPGERRGEAGEHAAIHPPRKRTKMTTLSQRIEDAQEDLTKARDALTDLTKSDEYDDEEADALTERIAATEARLTSLRRAEKALEAKADEGQQPTTVQRADRRPFAVSAKKVEPHEYMLRAATIRLFAHATKQPLEVVRQQLYGDDEATKVVSDVVLRAASAPATTTTSGWASQLVQTVHADFMAMLTPQSVYPGLADRGLRLTFGRNGVISIPTRAATPTIAGSFVAEGGPIPVRQGAFSAVTLTPKKLAVISTFTREISEHSVPAIEGLIRNAIQEDTSTALDTILLDATAVSATRPAGLRNGVSVTTATSGGGFAALVGDIKALTGALITASNGRLRSPVWIMNPVQALAASLTQNAGGDFPFEAEINGGRFRGYPLIVSSTVTAGMVFLVDAADFVSVTGDEPRFDVSDQATLHMEDTTPAAIVAAGSPNVTAAPVRSLWQTDSVGLRMIMPMNWIMRRAVVAWTQSVTW